LPFDQEPNRRYDQYYVTDKREKHVIGIFLFLAETSAGDVKPPDLRLRVSKS